MKKVHGEIIYTREDGIEIHSDICPPKCNMENVDKEIRDFYHKCLDEWLNKSNGTGIFYLKEESYKNYGNENIYEKISN